jgi:hypothetical protein
VYTTSRLGGFTAELLAAGLVRRIEPEAYVPNIPSFTESFLKVLDAVRDRLGTNASQTVPPTHSLPEADGWEYP